MVITTYHQRHKLESALWGFATHKKHHQHSLSPPGIEWNTLIAQTHYPAKLYKHSNTNKIHIYKITPILAFSL